jgi:voltage-gated sodium channel
MSSTLRQLVDAKWFQNTILVVILVAGALAGLETYAPIMERAGDLLHLADKIVVGIFLLEILVKMGAEGNRPWRFFKDPWNVFDFAIVAIAFLPLHAEYMTVLRLARLARFMRLIRALPQLQVIVGALLKSVPSMGYVGVLLATVLYIYGILGVSMFGRNDPIHFATLPQAMLTLFGCATGEGWVDVMFTQIWGCAAYPASGDESLCTDSTPQPFIGALFFISFMMVGAMVMLNLFIGVIMNGMEETQKENAEAERAAQGNTLTDDAEVGAIAEQLAELQARLALLQGRLKAGPSNK